MINYEECALSSILSGTTEAFRRCAWRFQTGKVADSVMLGSLVVTPRMLSLAAKPSAEAKSYLHRGMEIIRTLTGISHLGKRLASMVRRAGALCKAHERERVCRQKRSRFPARSRRLSARARNGRPAAEIAIQALDQARAPDCSAAGSGGAS
jgi:hypothetical protein